MSPSAFDKQVRSWFEVWLIMYLDNRRIVRSLVLHGIVDLDIVACILKRNKKKWRIARFGTSHVELKSLCGICVERSSQSWSKNARKRKELELKKLEDGTLRWLRLRGLVNDYVFGRLHAKDDNANVAYDVDIARKHDLTFQPRETCVSTKPSRYEPGCSKKYTDSEYKERVYRLSRAVYGASEWSENFCFGVWLVEWRLRLDRRDRTRMNRASVG